MVYRIRLHVNVEGDYYNGTDRIRLIKADSEKTACYEATGDFETSGIEVEIRHVEQLPDEDYQKVLDMQHRLYGLYQLEWMKEHGYTVSDVLKIARDYMNESLDPGVSAPISESVDGIENCVEDYGFDHGSLWAGKEEFLDTEYQNTDYVRDLILSILDKDDQKRLAKAYETDTGVHIDLREQISVDTPSGKIVAIATPQSYDADDYPGITVIAKDVTNTPCAIVEYDHTKRRIRASVYDLNGYDEPSGVFEISEQVNVTQKGKHNSAIVNNGTMNISL